MKNNFFKISLFVSAASFLILSVFSAFLYREIKNNNQKAEQENAEWHTETSRREEIISLNDSLQKIASDKTELETHFAKSSDVVPFLDTIEKLAPEVGAVAEIDSVDTGTDNNSFSIGLKASGSFEAIYKFLTLLENSPYELDFLSMDLHRLTMPEVPGKIVQNTKWEAVFEIKLLTFLP